MPSSTGDPVGVHLQIDPIVEGNGDVEAVPHLIRRIAADEGIYTVSVRKPHRVPRTQMDTDILTNAVVAHRDADLVVVVLDADDDPPETLLTALTPRVTAARTVIGIPVHEYEAWILAGISSLRSATSVRDDAVLDGDPERPRDAKGALRQLMTEPYRETLHQAKLTAQIDLEEVARSSPSFRRFREVFVRELRAVLD